MGYGRRITDKNNSRFAKIYSHFAVKIKRDQVLFSLVFQIDPQTAISLERIRRELSIDMAVGGPILKTSGNTT